MQSLGYLLNRWGRQIELMRFWHGFPTIEATYKAFFGPGGFSGGRLPIPDIEADIIVLNLKILALSRGHQDALLAFYGYSSKPSGGYYSDGEKASALRISVVELRSRIHFAKKMLLKGLKESCEPASVSAVNARTAEHHHHPGKSAATHARR